MARGAPDFWLRGTRIDLIDLINTIKTIESIEKILSVREAYIKNIPALMNAGFETGDLTGWATGWEEYYRVGKAYKFSGQYALNCKPWKWTMYIEQVLEIPVIVKYLSHLTFYAYAADPEFYDSLVRCRCIYTDATYTDHDFTIPNDGAWHDCNMLPYLDTTKDLRTIRLYILEVAGEPRETWLDDFILVQSPPRVILGTKALSGIVEYAWNSLLPGYYETIYDVVGKTVIIESLEIDLQSRDEMTVEVRPYVGDATLSIPIYCIYDQSYARVTYDNVKAYTHPLFDAVFEDAVAESFKLRFKGGVKFPHGVNIRVSNVSAVDTFSYYAIMYYAIEGE